MKERGIIFNGAMVRAILDGRKTQTRRIVANVLPDNCLVLRKPTKTKSGVHTHVLDAPKHNLSPFGQPGDRLWVRETFGYVSPDEHERPHSECNIEYRADLPPGCTDRPGNWPVEECAGDPARPRWRPSIHMPRSACRILLEITSVRVERLNDISEQDALAEGMDDGTSPAAIAVGWFEKPRKAFRRLWEQIYGEESWKANPWVWVYEFKVITTSRQQAAKEPA